MTTITLDDVLINAKELSKQYHKISSQKPLAIFFAVVINPS